MELVKTLALSTSASFSYSPPEEEIDNVLNKEFKISLKTLTTFDKLEGDMKVKADEQFKITELREKAKAILIERENLLHIQKRSTVGDASESGLIKFV